MFVSPLTEVQLNQLEYCRTVGTHTPSSATFKVHIPKVMPLISPSVDVVTVGFNNNITVNAKDCKPTIGTTISTQGFYTAKRFQNVNLSHKGIVFDQGTPLIIAVMDGNINDISVTDNI